MAKCGCGTTTCSCKVIQGANVTVTGSGSGADPYIVSAAFSCASARACFSASLGVAYNVATGNFTADISTDAGNTLVLGSDTGLFVPASTFACADARACFSVLDTTTVDMTYNVGTGVFSGVVRVDPAGLITTNANGLFLNCAAVRTCFTGGDALNYDPTTGDFDVCLSTDPGNTIVLGTDGCLFVPAGAFTLLSSDTPTVNTTITGGNTVSADVIIDPSANNVLTATANGLLVDIISGPCGLSGQGTAASPLVANVGTWPFACAQSANATDVYCDPTTGQLQGPPPKTSTVQTANGGITPGSTPVPNVVTTIETATITLINTDPCNDAVALLVWESDVTIDIGPGAQIDTRMNGDVTVQQENQSAGTAVRQALQMARGQQFSIPAGGNLVVNLPISIQQTVGAGSVWNRVQWRIQAHITSV